MLVINFTNDFKKLYYLSQYSEINEIQNITVIKFLILNIKSQFKTIQKCKYFVTYLIKPNNHGFTLKFILI